MSAAASAVRALSTAAGAGSRPYDVAIVGAGMVGAAVAALLRERHSVARLLLC